MSWLAIAELPASKVQSVHSSVAAAFIEAHELLAHRITHAWEE